MRVVVRTPWLVFCVCERRMRQGSRARRLETKCDKLVALFLYERVDYLPVARRKEWNDEWDDEAPSLRLFSGEW